MSTERISPTAHYTGAVWQAAGLGHPALQAALRPGLHRLASPLLRAAAGAAGVCPLDEALLQRHLGLDALVRRCAAAGARRVLEAPAGWSARGLRLAGLGLRWVDADLPAVADRRRRALEGQLPAGHRVVEVDLLQADGPRALASVLADDPQPTVILVEGLFNYFDEATVTALWARAARALDPCGGWLIGDVALRDRAAGPAARAFFAALGALARGAARPHFDGPEAAAAALRAAGFDAAEVGAPGELAPDVPPPASGARPQLALSCARRAPRP